MNIQTTLRTLPVLLVLILAGTSAVHAQSADKSSPAGIFPAQANNAPEFELTPAEETHPMIRLTPDKPQIVHLEGQARSVIVGNPAHLNAIMDNQDTLVLVPRDPGATYFTVIGQDGKILMQRYVIIAGPADKYIRIRRSCASAGTAACNETTVYYCPDMCYETKIMGSAQGQPTGSTGGNAGSGTGGLTANGGADNEPAPQLPPVDPTVSPATGRPVTAPATPGGAINTNAPATTR